MAHVELDLRERRIIQKLSDQGVRVAEIALQVGRQRSTIYRELKRNRCRFEDEPELNGYYCSIAHGFAADRRRRRAKLLRDPELQAALIDRLVEGWSPEQISGRMRHEETAVKVCHETIYAFVYSKDGLAAGLARHLPERRKRRRPRPGRKPRDGVFPADRSIHARPQKVNERKGFGHWEW